MDETLPFVSVIVPVFNGESTIGECLNSLMRMDYPTEKREIVVVDNNSTDGTSDIVKKYAVKYVREARQGIPYARNRGIVFSKGDILVWVDADCLVTTKWLNELVQGFDNKEIGVVAGEVVAFPSQTPAERFMATYKPRWNGQNLSFPDKKYFITACLGIRREVFQEIGLFDAQFAGVACEDIDFSWRFFRDSSFKFDFRPKAIVFHRNRSSAPALFSRYFRIGQGQALLMQKHPYNLRWSSNQEIESYKDLLSSLVALGRTAIYFRSKNGEMMEFHYQYFELVRKLAERIGWLYAMLWRFRT